MEYNTFYLYIIFFRLFFFFFILFTMIFWHSTKDHMSMRKTGTTRRADERAAARFVGGCTIDANEWRQVRCIF